MWNVLRADSDVFRRMRQWEHMRAVGTHNEPTRIYRPTGQAITAGTAEPVPREPSYHTAIAAGPRCMFRRILRKIDEL
jgi:hypothetical protein